MKNILKGAFALALLVMLMIGAVVPQEIAASTRTIKFVEQSFGDDASVEMQVGLNHNHVGKFVGGQWSIIAVPIAGMEGGTEQSFTGGVGMLPITALTRCAVDHRGAGQNLPPKKPMDFRSQCSSKQMSNLKPKS